MITEFFWESLISIDHQKTGTNLRGILQDTLIFIDVIGQLGLVELPLKGRSFTWSNMQQDPLLEQLDWFFTSVNWTTQYPNTMVHPMSKPISDHIPCKIMIGTSIPKSSIFRFENFWPEHPGFLETVQASWSSPSKLEEIWPPPQLSNLRI